MAPRTKPTSLKLLHGDHLSHPERINQSEPQAPEAPRDLVPPFDLDDPAREAWDHYGPILRRSRLLTEADVMAFAALWESWVGTSKRLRRCGPRVRSRWGRRGRRSGTRPPWSRRTRYRS